MDTVSLANDLDEEMLVEQANDELRTKFSANVHRFSTGCPFFHMNFIGLFIEMNAEMFVRRSEGIDTLFFIFQLSNDLLKDMITKQTNRSIDRSMNLLFFTVVEFHPDRAQGTDRVEGDDSTGVRQHVPIHW